MLTETLKPLIDEKLRSTFDEAISQAQKIDPSYADLLTVTCDQLLRSGKRLRPLLTYTVYFGYGGSNEAGILSAAASQELFHHFLLLHDDVMDRDLVRHGGPNVAGTYYQRFLDQSVSRDEAYHYGASFALLAGNASCALGLQLLSESSFESERRLAALASVHRMLFEEMGGQLTDIGVTLPGAPAPSLDKLLRICQYKSASYTFETPLQVGSLLAGAPAEDIGALTDFARSLGVAFQLADDVLGVFGDEAVVGKPILSDLHEGKQTVLMHYAFASASPAQAKQLRGIWGQRDVGTPELATVRELLEATGARGQVNKLAEEHLAKGLEALAETRLSTDAKAQLTHIANFSIKRQY